MLKDIRSITPHVSVNSASSNAVSRAPPSLVENNVDSREYQRRSSSGACGGSESDALLEVIWCLKFIDFWFQSHLSHLFFLCS